MPTSATVPVVRSAALSLPGIAHGFLTRKGGVSDGDLTSLNCGIGSDDDPERVAENRRRAAHAVLPGASLVGVYQVHGNACATVAVPWSDDDRPHADALVTDRAEVLLGILTADCTPVLFADAEASVVGAAHAGWKGALSGVTDTTIAAMEALGAVRDRIVAAIGPTIGRKSYEVDDAFVARYVAHDPDNERFFAAGRSGHAHFDLPAYVAHRLAAAGVRTVADVGCDTLSNPDRFFSYRRATLSGQNSYGRQISLIGLTGER